MALHLFIRHTGSGGTQSEITGCFGGSVTDFVISGESLKSWKVEY